ncbi:G-protein alpha subunit-domain-containing protein [Whalleya microplaca]|nr:G-protein alpha subunit-domain-containing protein [Whalleya microplaca]
MDPASVFQIVGTVISISDVVFKCIKRLNTLKTKYRDAPMLISTLIGQLSIIETALEQLSAWKTQELGKNPRLQRLASRIDIAFDCFSPLIIKLQKELDGIDAHESSELTTRDRLSFLWSEEGTASYLVLLGQQVTTLTLLLQVVQSTSLIRQNDIIWRERSQYILEPVRDCSLSIDSLGDPPRLYRDATRHKLTNSIDTGPSQKMKIDMAEVRLTVNTNDNSMSQNTSTRRISEHIFIQRVFGVSIVPGPVTFYVIGDPIPSHYTREQKRKWVPKQGHEDRPYPDVNSTVEECEENRESLGDNDLEGSQARGRSDVALKVSEPNMQLAAVVNRLGRRLVYNRVGKTLPQTSQSKRSLGQSQQKLLILGTSTSGKSTLLRALRYAAGEDVFRESMQSYRGIIRSHAIESVISMLRWALDNNRIDKAIDYVDVQRYFLNPESLFSYSSTVSTLWADSKFRAAYQEFREEPFIDNSEYYITSIDRLSAPEYIPTNGDIMRSSVRTAGISKYPLSFHGHLYTIFDMGGCRPERRKWIHSFEDVSTILYTVDTTAYSKMLYEDTEVNQMLEELLLFESMAKGGWFEKTNLILIFTKIDLLEACLRDHAVTSFFPDFRSPGPDHELEHYIHYLETEFLKIFRSKDVRRRIRVVRANLVDIDNSNPAMEVFEALEEFSLEEDNSE